MPLKRYRVIVKVLCSTCLQAKGEGKINENCPHCEFLKYRDVTKLASFTAYLDKKYPDWVWFKVYEYVKGGNGSLLRTFKNTYKTYRQDGNKWVYTGTTRDVPIKEQL